MSRIAEVGLEYTYLDVNILSDRKIRRLKRRAGKAAPYIYIALLTAIFKEGYYIQWDEDAILDITDATDYEEEFVANAVSACLEVGLFSKKMYEDYQILTSVGIQRQYNLVCQKSKRKSKVNEFSLLIPSEEKPIPSEEIPINSEDMPQSREEKRKGKKSNSKEDYFSSFCPPSIEEDLTAEEKEKEKFVSFFTFVQNYVAPNFEYQRMVAFNNGPQAKKKWAEFSDVEKQAIMALWHPEKETVQEHKKRHSESFLPVWMAVYKKLQERGAPYDVRMAALSDNLKWDYETDRFILYCPEVLYKWIEIPIEPSVESNLQYVKPILWPLMQKFNCKDLVFRFVKQ